MAVRLLICWLYVKTGSVLLAQLVHASSTGFLVVLNAPRVTAWQEASWYGAYAVSSGWDWWRWGSGAGFAPPR
jgi:hypothetical protein